MLRKIMPAKLAPERRAANDWNNKPVKPMLPILVNKHFEFLFIYDFYSLNKCSHDY
jgi:hypothetical protein